MLQLHHYPGNASLASPLGTPARAHFYKRQVWLTNTLQAMLIHYFYSERLVDERNMAATAQIKAHAEARVRLGIHPRRMDAR